MTVVLRALTAALFLVSLAACGSTAGNINSSPAPGGQAGSTSASTAGYPAPGAQGAPSLAPIPTSTASYPAPSP